MRTTVDRAAGRLLKLGGCALAGVANARWPRRRGHVRIAISFLPAWVVSELPLHLIAAATSAAAALVRAGGARNPRGRLGLGMLALSAASAVPAALRARTFRVDLDDLDASPLEVPYPASHVALPTLAWRRRDVRRVCGIEYARVDGQSLRLDMTRPTGAEHPLPAIVHVHGGGMMFGSRREQGVPLLGHLAANGWAGFNIDYRHSPRVTFPAQLHDVKRAIAWVRAHAEQFGVDPSFIALTGGSAGGLLTALTALTSDRPDLQPGFTDADASVQAAVPLYGVYDLVDDDALHLPVVHDSLERWIIKARRLDAPEAFARASPIRWVRPDAPPFMIVHPQRDSIVPVDDARRFAKRLASVSAHRVELVEVPSAQHAFDLIPSWHTLPVLDAIARFLRATYADHLRAAAAPQRDSDAARR